MSDKNNDFFARQFQELLDNAQKMKDQMAKEREKLATLRAEGSAGGGIVRVRINGERQVTQVEIDDEGMDDRDLLQDLVTAAVNDALGKIDEQIKENLSDALPGMFKMIR